MLRRGYLTGMRGFPSSRVVCQSGKAVTKVKVTIRKGKMTDTDRRVSAERQGRQKKMWRMARTAQHMVKDKPKYEVGPYQGGIGETGGTGDFNREVEDEEFW